MAETLLKTTPGSGYVAGDVLCCFNDRRIRCVHAEHLCALKGFNRDGLRSLTSLARYLRQRTHQYEFVRVSQRTVERRNLWTGEIDTFGQESIDVEEFIRRRRQHDRHAIFGSTGFEIWYGGRIDTSDARLDSVWTDIETHSPRIRSEAEFQLWPMGRLDIRHHLAVRVANMTDDAANELVRHKHKRDRNGERVWELHEISKNGDRILRQISQADEPEPSTDKLPEGVLHQWQNPVIAKREVAVNWERDLLADLAVTKAAVEDKEIAVGVDVQTAGGMRYQSKPQRVQDVAIFEVKAE